MKQKILLTLVGLVFVGCAQQELRSVHPHERTLYERGTDSLSEGKYEQAQSQFSDLLKEFPSSRWYSNAMLQWGFSLEKLGRIDEAVEKYRKVVDFYQGLHSKDEAEALYRLSHCYEALNNDEKLIFTLLELKPSLKNLPLEISEAEWPARLAAAYARQNNYEQAQKYYFQAEAGLKKMRQSIPSTWLPKTYFSMGHISEERLKLTNLNEFNAYLSSLDTSMPWLMRAMNSKAEPWSQKAEAEIQSLLSKAWSFLDHLQLQSENSDALLSAKKKQEMQKILGVKLDEILNKMKLERSPGESANFKAFIKSYQQRLDLLLQERDIQDKNTIDSQLRNSPKKKGRMLK